MCSQCSRCWLHYPSIFYPIDLGKHNKRNNHTKNHWIPTIINTFTVGKSRNLRSDNRTSGFSRIEPNKTSFKNIIKTTYFPLIWKMRLYETSINAGVHKRPWKSRMRVQCDLKKQLFTHEKVSQPNFQHFYFAWYFLHSHGCAGSNCSHLSSPDLLPTRIWFSDKVPFATHAVNGVDSRDRNNNNAGGAWNYGRQR